ncbi:GNAT family N-acetyltransferase [Dongia mobilis]|jgi:ribosomal protein S18 acetylase RimI-like enzyme|uniref:GNAT family N-acetyltransferase n=1 Tax=Dongia sp. TaxID=1977262 RepID=UPI0026F184E0
MPRIEALTPKFATKDRFALIELLMDVVEAGAAISFLPPMTEGEAGAFWDKALSDLSHRSILVARDAAGRIQGSVQLIPAAMPNQPHRAEIAKLLVHTKARRKGIGRALMLAAEAEAKSLGRTLLTLDTRRGDDGEALYRNLGYVEVGIIPRYAKNADGSFHDTVVFYKELGA